MKTLGEIAELVGGTLEGDPECKITGFAGIDEARAGELTFLEGRKYQKHLNSTKASAAIVPLTAKAPASLNVIFHKSPSEAFAAAIETLWPVETIRTSGTHSKAEIEEGATIGKNVCIDAFAVVRSGARIGNKTVLYPFVYIGKNVSIGSNCLIYPNVTVHDNCVIGNKVIIHSGTVIGGDGFGYVTKHGKHIKIPQRGIVEIGHDVEIGSNVTIDRARVGKTIIGHGTKIDNLVMIAHNVKIGEDSIIVAQAGISGSTELGRNVTVAGQAGFAGHIKIGDNSVIGARSGVLKNLPSKSVVSGFPAMDHRKELNLLAYYRRLPEILERLEALEKAKKEENKD